MKDFESLTVLSTTVRLTLPGLHVLKRFKNDIRKH